jgi:hypothetical protein
MGTTRTLADGEAFVQGRSQATAAKLVTAAAELDRKGSVKTTYDGYVAPVEVVDAAGLGEVLVHTESSTPERGEGAPIDQLEASPAQNVDGDVPAGAVEATEKEEVTDAGDAEEDYSDPENPASDNVDAEVFDPTAHTIADVEAYLAEASDDERARVIAAEQESTKPRKGVLDLAATQEGK